MHLVEWLENCLTELLYIRSGCIKSSKVEREDSSDLRRVDDVETGSRENGDGWNVQRSYAARGRGRQYCVRRVKLNPENQRFSG